MLSLFHGNVTRGAFPAPLYRRAPTGPDDTTFQKP